MAKDGLDGDTVRPFKLRSASKHPSDRVRNNNQELLKGLDEKARTTYLSLREHRSIKDNSRLQIERAGISVMMTGFEPEEFGPYLSIDSKHWTKKESSVFLIAELYLKKRGLLSQDGTLAE